jgi:hypothetical protein
VSTARQQILAGGVSEFDVRSLITAFGLGRQAIRLEVLDPSGQCDGCIVMQADRVLSAVAGELTGVEAMQRLLAATHPAHFKVFRESRDAVSTQPDIGTVAEFTRPVSGRRPLSVWRERIPVMEGSLADFSFSDVMRSVSMARQHSMVEVLDHDGAHAGVVHVKAGQMLSARAGPLVDRRALRHLLGVPTTFRFAVFRDALPITHARPLGSVADALLQSSTPALGAANAIVDEDPRYDEMLEDESVEFDEDTVVGNLAPHELAPRRSDIAPLAVMDGNLAEFDIPSVLQVVGTSRQRTSVRVFDDQRGLAGEVHLKGGHVLSAEAAGESGVAAVRRLLHSPRDFTFVVLRLPDAGSDLASIGAIGDVLADAVTLTVPQHIAAPGSIETAASLNATRQVVAEPRGRRPYIGWLVSATVGAGFVLLGAGAATLLVQRDQIASRSPREGARRGPVELESKISPASDSAAVRPAQGAAPAAPAQPTEVRPVGAVFGQADPNELALGRPAIASMQAGLKLLGYAPGAIDGVIGPRTTTAIKAFQHAEHLTEDGNLSLPTRARLAARVGGL